MISSKHHRADQIPPAPAREIHLDESRLDLKRQENDRRTLVVREIVAALLGSTLLTTDALAQCSPPDKNNTVVCSGDLSAGVSETNRTEVTVKNVTTTIAPAAGVPGVVLVNRGAVGPSGGAGGAGPVGTLLLFGPFDIRTQGADAATLTVQGGRGGNGVGTTGSAGAAGGNGGGAFQARLSTAGGTYMVTSIDNEIAALSVRSKGGDGGDGANPTLVPGVTIGGAGGNGGRASLVTFFLPNATVTTSGSGPASAVRASAEGGDGGKGGQVESTGTAEVRGGNGGNGGGGGPVLFSLENNSISAGAQGAPVLLAQSLGGNGGDGGNAVIGGTAPTAVGGGDGGDGGDASTVSVNGDFTLTRTTAAANSTALVAQSLAGQGGAGGNASDNIGVAIGGNGGVGGTGGGVTIGTMTTPLKISIVNMGNQSGGMLARSYGGAGGAGGQAFTNGQNGNRSGPGPGGAVSVYAEGSVTTFGVGAAAVTAQSVGGFSADASGSDIVQFGASAQSGGRSGAVIVDLTPDSANAPLATNGDNSDAVIAQSIGGGGGTLLTGGSIENLGGSGDAGGDGDAVTVTLNMSANGDRYSVSTTADNSRGIDAESIGSGGGSARAARAQLIGATGGSGGSAGAVTVTSSADISTKGAGSDAIYAGSHGGGGGSGGLNGFEETQIGGSGAGGAGGAVSVGASGTLQTVGDDADAVFAQSVGGGGGKGLTVPMQTTTFSQTIGGSGGDGGDGGKVTVAVTDDGGPHSISALGRHSRGILAQSVGGGGGDGGNTLDLAFDFGKPKFAHAVGGSGGKGGVGGDVSVSSDVAIATAGSQAAAIHAQSVGGGGGSAGNALSVSASLLAVSTAIGGSGGGGGSGGTVDVTATQPLTTAGDSFAPGVIAHSVGGGGGHGGSAVAVTAASLASITASSGGSGGVAGNGEAVTVNVGNVATEGTHSHGVSALSVGGGGGSGGTSVTAGVLSLASVGLTLGGAGGSGGDGGAVNVTTGAVSTKGDYSAGISALSVGGGGGDSGTVVSVSALKGVQALASVGASGGAGGNAGDVSVTATGGISTEGAKSAGVRALSVAGGGGSSGVVVNAGAADIAGVTFATGGAGGAGGTSGNVTVKAEAGAATKGTLSQAVHAASIAGGGGDSGAVVAVNALSMGDMSVAIGKDGGGGGTAGTASVTTGGSVLTSAVQSPGIVAQSLAGGGGHGGLVGEGSLTGGEFSGNLSLSVAGNGAAGGKADTVDVTTTGTITTADYRSSGIIAQSIGGHGGVGGSVYSGNLNLSATAGTTFDIEVGGSGGDGGSAKKVTVNNAAGIDTGGFDSVGILAQSIGGSGGDAGGAYTASASITEGSTFNVSADVGGSGGEGAVGGAVAVTNTGRIATAKGGSAGIQAQSIGGGGGRGGAAANIIVDFRKAEGKTFNVAAEFSVGGRGGTGADAGAVSVTNASTISTDGVRAFGIAATSVGGGGGDGGAASATSIDVQGVCTLATLGKYTCTGPNDDKDEEGSLEASLDVAIGGSGGASGDGEMVTVDNEAGGDITTTGRVSHAIFAHSIGGGGGHGGEGGLGIEAWTSNKTIQDIDNTFSDITQPPSFTSISAAIGGSGGASGDGGAVEISNAAVLTTKGDHSFGIHTQSIGGGGGSGGGGSGGLWTALTVGGGGSGGGDGGDVTVKNTNLISTSGVGSVGIFAQSVGGGGGAAGDVENGFAAPWLDLNIGAGVGIQENAGAGGDGGTITVDTGTIITSGARAHGVVAQSVGGSGGIAQVSGALQDGLSTYVGSGGAAGSGGSVTVNTTGPVSVSGANAVGIVALSAAGSGASNSSGTVTVNVTNDVTASGTGGRGILASSATQAGQNAGSVNIAVAAGAKVSTGEAGAETIGVRSTGSPSIVNNGTIESGNPDSFAIRVDDDAAFIEVTNSAGATLTGSVVLPPAAGFLANSGLFNMGRLVSLAGFTDPASKLIDSNGLILNTGGTLSPAGIGTVGTTDYFGGRFEWEGGTYAPDLQLAAGGTRADLIKTVLPFTTPRNDIVVDGIIAPNVTASAGAGSLKGSAVIMNSNQLFNISSAQLKHTGAATFTLSTSGKNALSLLNLGYKINGTPWSGDAAERAKVPLGLGDRIGRNTNAFGRFVEALFVNRVANEEANFAAEVLTNIINLPDVPTLVSAYEEFLPEEVFAATDGAFLANLRFVNDLHNCGSIGAAGVINFAVEGGGCAYARLSGFSVQRNGNGSRTGYDEQGFALSAGGQARVGERTFLGGGLGIEIGDTDIGATDGDLLRLNLAAVARADFGLTQITASVGAEYYETDLSRPLKKFAPEPLTAKSTADGYAVSAHGRIDRRIDLSDRVYLRPTLDLGLTFIHQNPIRERGAGPFAMKIDGFDQTIFTANPFLEIGADVTLGSLPGRARIRGGVLVTEGSDREASARFAGLHSGLAIAVGDDYDTVFGDVGVALDLAVGKQATVEVKVDALVSESQHSVAGGVRFNLHF